MGGGIRRFGVWFCFLVAGFVIVGSNNSVNFFC